MTADVCTLFQCANHLHLGWRIELMNGTTNDNTGVNNNTNIGMGNGTNIGIKNTTDIGMGNNTDIGIANNTNIGMGNNTEKYGINECLVKERIMQISQLYRQVLFIKPYLWRATQNEISTLKYITNSSLVMV